jgi:hypothetical protein
VIRSKGTLRATTFSAVVAAAASLWSTAAHADIPLTDPATANGWDVSTSGRVDAYLSWLFGETVNSQGRGNLTGVGAIDRYILVGPQIGIKGNAVPEGAVADTLGTKLNGFRVRGGFASTILGFNILKQINPDLKLTIRQQIWAGIQNAQNAAGIRQYNDSASVDWREQWMQLEGSWGLAWAGRRIGLYNRGGMRMDWYLMHNHGVGQPCDADSAGSATCGHTGTGSMFPARHAQLGYATPEMAGFQLNLAVLDPAMIDAFANPAWNRTPLPRFETELTYHKNLAEKDEINVWANGLTQQVGRTAEQQPAMGVPGIPADKVLSVFGVGGGAWFRVSGIALGGTAWFGKGLGTAWAMGSTAVDDAGNLRTHFGYLGIGSYRAGDFEIAVSYGSANAKETPWDADPTNPNKISLIKEVRGIGADIGYHVGPVTFSVDGMNVKNTWHRGETQVYNVVSAGMMAEW